MSTQSRFYRVAALLALVMLVTSVLGIPAATPRALAAASAAPASSVATSVAAATTTMITAASPSLTVNEGQVAANSGTYSHHGPAPLRLDVSVGALTPLLPTNFSFGPANAFTFLRLWQLGENDAGAADGATGSTFTNAWQKSASTAYVTGNASRLTRQGSPTYTAVDGSYGSVLAMSFNGSTDGYTDGSVGSETPTDNFGIEAQVKPNGVSGPQVVAYFGDTTSNGFGILIDDAGHAGSPTYWVRYGGVTTVDTGVAVTPGIWHDVALVRDQGVTKLFVDAALAYNSSIAAPNLGLLEPFGIGQDPLAASNFYSGSLDDVRFFLFNAGAFSVQDLAPNQSVSNTWSWSSVPDDGPAQSQNVTFTASTGVSGDSTSLSIPLTVNNVAPTATFSNRSAGSVSFSGQSDPSAADRAAGFHYAYDFNNDGTFDSGDGSYAGSGTAATATVPASFLTGVASRTVRGRIVDKDGGFTDYTTTIIISVTVNEGQVAANSGTYSHSGPAPVTFSASVGSVSQTSSTALNVRGYWQLGEDDAGAADTLTGNASTLGRDASGLNPALNLTRAGSPTYTAVDGSNGSVLAMSFNGSADGYTLASPVSTATDNFGMEAWVRPPDFTGAFQPIVYNGVLGNRITPGNGFGLTIFDDDYAVTYGRVGGFTTFDSGVEATPGVWHHVALVRDSGVTKFYVDGALVFSNSSTIVTVPATSGFAIGNSLFVGAIDDVRVFTFAPGTFNPADLGYNGVSGTWSWSYTTDDGPAQSQNVTIASSTGVSGDTSSLPFALIVNNVAPTASFANGGAVNSGSAGSVSFSGQSDPSAADRAAGFHYAYDFNNDGTFDSGDGTYAGSGAAASATVPASFLTGAGSHTVRGRIVDKDGGSTDYTTTITVNAANHAPVAANDSYSANQDTSLTVAAPGVLANDTDADNNPLMAIKVSDPAHGAVTLNANGSFTYTPAAGYNGPDSFTYKANDGTADSNVATVSITVVSNWAFQGPAPQTNGQQVLVNDAAAPVAGAVNAIAPSPTNPDLVYIGSTNGGVWKTTNATAANPTWTPLTDNLKSLSIGAIALDPLDATSQTLLVGTGRFSGLGGIGDDTAGLYYTTDGGATWSTSTGTNNNLSAAGISAVAARGSIMMAASANGLFRSMGGMAGPWNKISGTGGLPTGVAWDLAADPKNSNTLYATFTGASAGIFRTDDAGATWTDVTNGIPFATTASIEFGISNSTNRFVAGVYNDGTTNAVTVMLNGTAIVIHISGATETGTTATITTVVPHGFSVGQSVTIAGVSVGGYNGTFTIASVPSPTTFTYTAASGLGNAAGGTALAGFQINSATEAGTTATITTAAAHGFSVGQRVGIAGVSVGGYNGTFTIASVPSSTTFTYTAAAAGLANAAGGTATTGTFVKAVYRKVGNNAFVPLDVPAGDYGGSGSAIRGLGVLADKTNANVAYIYGYGVLSSNPFRTTVYRLDASLPSGSQAMLLSTPIPASAIGDYGAPHVDINYAALDSTGGLWIGSHGGLFRLAAPASPASAANIWVSKNGNLSVFEIHDIAYDHVSHTLLGGMQDNGEAFQSAPGSQTWAMAPSGAGDGGDVAVDTTTLASVPSTTLAAATTATATTLSVASAAGYPSGAQFVITVNSEQMLVTGIAGTTLTVTRGVLGTTKATHSAGASVTTPPQSVRYASNQNLGTFRRYVYNAANGLVSNTAIGTAAVTDPQFVTPIATNAVNSNFLLIGGSGHIYESTDRGATIAALADPVGVNSSTYKGPIAYGGRLNSVANPYVLYVGFGTKVYARTAAGGALAATAALPAGATNLQSIALNPADYTNVFAMDNTHVYMSSDGGASWSNITGNLLAVSSAQFTALAFVPGTAPYIAVGTRSGVFASPLSSLGTWAKLRNGLPDVPVFDLAYDATDDVLAAGTLGRAAWTLPRASAALNAVAALALSGASTAREGTLATYAGTGFSFTSYITGLSTSGAAPTASASGPASALAGQVVTFVLRATDSSPANQAAGFTYSVDWGDSSPIQTVDPVAGNGDATARHAFAAAGSYNIQVTATNKDGATSLTAGTNIAIIDLNATSLQTLIATTPIVYLQPASDAALHGEVSAIDGLSAPASHVDITIVLGAGPYSGITLRPPDGITLDVAGTHTADVAGTQIASSTGSAVTVTSGEVFVQGVGLTTSADAPTVLVTGGHLTIAQNSIQESTGANNVAIALTGGEVELGLDMVLNINGLGGFFSTYDPDAIGFPDGVDADLTPNNYEVNGVPVSATHLSATDLSSSANPSVFGQAVTFTADVDAEAGENGPATGTVTFYDGATALGSGTLSPVGGDTFTASFTTSALSVGTHTITAVYGGNSVYVPSSAKLSLVVNIFPFAGFFQPVDNSPTLNSVNSGAGIPVKFSLGGNRGLGILAAGSPSSQQIACSNTGPIDDIETTTTSNSGLTYDVASGQYTYTWKTDKTWAGTCRQFNLKLTDGTTYTALFKFTK